MQFDKLLNVREVAERLRFHPVSVRRLAESGKLPGLKAGGQWRFRWDEVEKAMRESAGRQS